MPLYQVINWEAHFEGSKSKNYKNKTSCQMPTKHGLGYRRLVRMNNGPAMFGAWCAMIQVLSRHLAPRSGYCTSSGRDCDTPLSAQDLEMLADIPADVFESMLQACASELVGWLREVRYPNKVPQGEHADTIVPLDLDLDLDSDSCKIPGEFTDFLQAKVGGAWKHQINQWRGVWSELQHKTDCDDIDSVFLWAKDHYKGAIQSKWFFESLWPKIFNAYSNAPSNEKPYHPQLSPEELSQTQEERDEEIQQLNAERVNSWLNQK